MLIDQEGIRLGGGETYYTLFERDAFRVIRGEVRVCVVEHSQQGLQRGGNPVCRVDARSALVIPALVLTPGGAETLCLALEAGADGAQLLRVPFEPEQRAQFFEAAGDRASLLVPFGAAPQGDGETILITQAAPFLADAPDASYCVESGAVYVFLMPAADSGMDERREFLCSAAPGDGFAIPGLNYRARGRLWHLSLEAAGGDARLRRMGCTRVAREKFLAAVQAQSGDGDGLLAQACLHEGFEEGLVQYYVRRNELADAVRESRQSRHREDVRQQVQQAIRSGLGERAEASGGDAPAVRVLEHLCRRSGIPLREEELGRCRPGMRLPEIAQTCGLICRRVDLEEGWFRRGGSPLVAKLDGRPVACIPCGRRGYRYYDTATGRERRLDAETAARMPRVAYAIGRSLPAGRLCRRDVVRFVLGGIRRRELLRAALLSALCLPAGFLLPRLAESTFDRILPAGDASALLRMGLPVCAWMLGGALFALLAALQSLSISSRAGQELQNAMYARIFTLPQGAISRYESADLAQRVQAFGRMAARITAGAVALGLSAIHVPLYLFQMAHYAGALVPGALALTAAYTLLVCTLPLTAVRYEAEASEKGSEASARLQQLLCGIEKIRMAGAEDQALLTSIGPVAGQQRAALRTVRLTALGRGLAGAVGVLLALVLLLVCGMPGYPVGRLAAFCLAYGALSSLVLRGAGALTEYRFLEPKLARLRPLLETAPETEPDRRAGPAAGPGGRITFDHVTFAYSPGSAPVLRDVSFDIQPGEYVGLAGCSGSGKSTVIRLLLGFESPQSGRVLYDGRDLAAMDRRALRRQLGVVLQNEGLIAGSLYDNIMLTCAGGGRAAAEAAVEKAGLREEIEAMPMHLETMVHEAFDTLSGGQKQRILLARAFAGGARVLLLDEATSALDNLSQAVVCRSLKQMEATRLVISHCPGVLEDCDRILVLHNGTIAEEGSYEQLCAGHGLFHEMIRQQTAGLEEGTER